MTKNIDDLLKLNEEEIYKQLESYENLDIDVSLADLSEIKASDTEIYGGDKSLPGKISLKKAWSKIRFVMCNIYKANPKIGDKELIDAVIAALGITGSWEVALVALALKKGLDKLCR